MSETYMSPLDRLSTTLNATIEKSLFVIGFSMAALVAVQVFFRYVLNHSLFWSEELARFLLIWLTFLGASVAYHRRAHPGIDMFSLLLPACLKKSAVICVHLASIGLFSVMIVYGCQFAYFVRLQISPALYLPKWIIFGIVPFSGGVLMLHALALFVRGLKEDSRGR
ncbi:MAG: TRAP transporter small permease [Desulfobacterales bacterium]|nr:TRAP transporter small permease [Desulfobacterales bacterium]